MSSSAIAGFIQGAVGGADLGMRWQNRKRQQKLDDEEREWQKQEREWAIEDRTSQRNAAANDRAWLEEERQRQRDIWAQEDAALAEEARAKKAFARAFEKADEAHTNALNEARTSTQVNPPPQSPTSPTRSAQPKMPAGRAFATAVTKTPSLHKPTTEAAPGEVDRAPLTTRPKAEPSSTPAVSSIIARSLRGAARSTGLVDDNRAKPGTAPGFEVAQSPSMSQPKRPSRSAPSFQTAATRGSAKTPPGAAAAQTPPKTPGAAMAAAATGQQPVKALVPSAAPGQEVVTPSVEAAAATAPQKTAFKRETMAQAEARVGSFLSYYQKVATPEIIRHYVSTGNIEAARAFEKWVSDAQTQEGMKHWAKAIQAGSLGDEEGFFDNLVSAFNTKGYSDNDLEVVRGKSGFIRDADGNPTGVSLTFRDADSGREWVQNYNDMNDFLRIGVNFMSPEANFERMIGQLDAADTAMAEEAEAELDHARKVELEVLKHGLKGETEAERIAEAKKLLLENSNANKYAGNSEALANDIADLLEADELAKQAIAKRAVSRGNLRRPEASPAAGN